MSALRLVTLPRCCAVVLCLGLASASAWSQISVPPRTTADFRNGMGVGVSYSEQNDRDADFWGWSVDYSRWLNNKWTAAVSLTWDEETERFVDKPDEAGETYTLIGTITYNLTPSLGVTTGLAQGIADDDNDDKEMRFKSGDVSTGVGLGYQIPISERNSIGLNVAYEYNISENETSYSVDLVFGWSF